MRVRNKEIRQRRHRKEQVIKAAEKALREQFGEGKKPAAAPAKKTTKKAAKSE